MYSCALILSIARNRTDFLEIFDNCVPPSRVILCITVHEHRPDVSQMEAVTMTPIYCLQPSRRSDGNGTASCFMGSRCGGTTPDQLTRAQSSRSAAVHNAAAAHLRLLCSDHAVEGVRGSAERQLEGFKLVSPQGSSPLCGSHC